MNTGLKPESGSFTKNIVQVENVPHSEFPSFTIVSLPGE